MNSHNVISLPVSGDLTGQEHSSVKLTSTGIALAGSGDRVIGVMLRGETKLETGGSPVGMAADVLLSAGVVAFMRIGNNTAIALGDELERSATAGQMVQRVAGRVAGLALQAAVANSSGGIIQVLILSSVSNGVEVPAQTQTALTDSSTGSASTTLAAVSAASAANADTSAAALISTNAAITALKNAVASLAAELALVKTDVAAILTALEGA